jgi:hypothetical protein
VATVASSATNSTPSRMIPPMSSTVGEVSLGRPEI